MAMLQGRALQKNLYSVAIHAKYAAHQLRTSPLKRPMDRIIFKKVGKRGRIGKVVYGNNLDVFPFQNVSAENTPYPSKTVYSNSHGSDL